jgi:hypothetical protein
MKFTTVSRRSCADGAPTSFRKSEAGRSSSFLPLMARYPHKSYTVCLTLAAVLG